MERLERLERPDPRVNGAKRWNASIELRAGFWNGWNRWNGLFLVTNEALAVELLERLERLERTNPAMNEANHRLIENRGAFSEITNPAS